MLPRACDATRAERSMLQMQSKCERLSSKGRIQSLELLRADSTRDIAADEIMLGI
jgi:hypothetical protein